MTPTIGEPSLYAYTVRAEFADAPTAERYLGWLTGGHVDAVVRAGALSGQIVELDRSGAARRLEVRYMFADRAAFDAYERDHARALRAEGLERFGQEPGIVWTRTHGPILFAAPRGR